MAKRTIKNLLALAVTIGLIYSYMQGTDLAGPGGLDSTSDNRILQNAYDQQVSDLQVQGEGIVVKVLSDDLDGSRHQRFIIRIGPDQTVLLSHNIDLAPRVDQLQAGDTVAFFGEYEWNPKGGVVHWTHHDPAGRHPDGWIRHNGKTYE